MFAATKGLQRDRCINDASVHMDSWYETPCNRRVTNEHRVVEGDVEVAHLDIESPDVVAVALTRRLEVRVSARASVSAAALGHRFFANP